MLFPVRRSVIAAASLSSLAILGWAGSASAQTVVQVPVDSVIDGRTVSTISGATITPWSAGQGVDGDGNADGYVTTAVEAALVPLQKTVDGKANAALPDDGKFAADARHPEVQLHFSNNAAITSPQTHQMKIAGNATPLMFNVPPAMYSKMFLFITASEGSAKLTITLNYSGGVAAGTNLLTLPDYGVGGATDPKDPVFFNLIAGMRKWSSTNQEGDGPSHTITGIELNPMPNATLTSIQVTKTNGSHCVFWGATGIANGDVNVAGSGGTGGASGGAGGVAGASGNAGAGGTLGTSGTGGAAAGASGALLAGASTGGAANAGASTGGAAGAPVQAGASSVAPSPSSDDSGCSLSTTRSRDARGWAALLVALGLVARRKRRA